MLTRMYRDTYKNESTITELWGTDKNIIYEKEEIEGMQVPTFSVGIQSNIYKLADLSVQTDLSLKGLKEMEGRIEDLINERDMLDKGNQLYETELQKLKSEINHNNLDSKEQTLQSAISGIKSRGRTPQNEQDQEDKGEDDKESKLSQSDESKRYLLIENYNKNKYRSWTELLI